MDYENVNMIVFLQLDSAHCTAYKESAFIIKVTSPNAHQHHQRMLESKKIFSIIFLMMLVFLHNHSGGSDPVIILINVSNIWRWGLIEEEVQGKAKSHQTIVVARKLAAFKSTSPFWLEFVLFSTIARFSYISLHCDYFMYTHQFWN